jgi:hypothetical protein
MSYGPIELVVLRFEGTNFEGDVLREIQKVVDSGTIVVIDILLAVRIGDDPVRVVEIQELEDPILQRWEPIITDAGSLLTVDDAEQLSADLGPDAAVALLVFEHRWVAGVADAIENAGGSVVMTERIPRAVVDQLVADIVAEA